MNKKQKSLTLRLSDEKNRSLQKINTASKHSEYASQQKKMPRLKRVSTSPGPGAYNTSRAFSKKKGITIAGHYKYAKKDEKKPDPWSYMPKTKFIQPRSPIATIGLQRKFQKIIKTPGPSDYNSNYKALLERSRVAVMGSSRKHVLIQKMPGPGDYDTLKADNILRRNVSIFIGKSSRPNQERSDSPGPSQYRIEDEFSLKTKVKAGFTMGSKIRSKTQCGEAPDNYLKYNAEKLTTLCRAPAFTIKKQKLKHLNISISPGPAAYSPTHKENGGITIPKSSREALHSSESNGGIATYTPVSETGPAFSIPRAGDRQRQMKKVLPGPADYKPETPKSQKYKSISIGLGDKFHYQTNDNPGPGNYNVKVNSSRSGYTIGHEQRKQQQRQALPGPADYFMDLASIRKYISQKKR